MSSAAKIVRLALIAGLAASVGLSLAQAPEGPTAKINEALSKAWKANDLKPSEPAADQEFIRRATLDIIGRIATPDEVRAFEKDKAADKRAKLIDRLLDSKEYASYWARQWTAWLVGRGTPEALSQPLEKWLEQQLAKNTPQDKLVTALLTASGSTADNGAVGFILDNLGEPIEKGKQAQLGQHDAVPLTLRTLRVFLGLRLQHNPKHPLHPDYDMKHFWRANCCFRQLDKNGNAVSDNPKLNTENFVAYETQKGETFSAPPQLLDGDRFDKGTGTRREQLAAALVKNDQFAKAQVNRIWGQFFGRGLGEKTSVDDFGSHNKLVHPELLDELAKAFAASGYDTKKLIRWIASSEAYQLSSIANESNTKPEAQVYFSRMPLKIMNPEQLVESIVTATQARKALDKEGVDKLRSSCFAVLANQGDSEPGEFSFSDNLNLAVTMINNRAVNDAIMSKNGTVAQAVAAGKDKPEAVTEELYLAAFNRSPNAKEKERLAKILEPNEKDLTPLWQDLLWALINSNEFLLNH